MTGRNPYLQSNSWSTFDHYLGVRGWGLIFYGTLPASLFALGFIKLETIKLQRTEIWLPILCISAVPVGILFVLVQQRLSAWYLFREGVWSRSFIITALILLFSTAISLMAGIVSGKYVSISWDDWVGLVTQLRWQPYLESFLIAIMSLVGSSTLFLTSVKDSGGLPGLPSADVVKDLQALREALRTICTDSIWQNADGVTINHLAEEIETSLTKLASLVQNIPTIVNHKNLYRSLSSDLSQLGEAILEVGTVPSNWEYYFDPECQTTSLSKAELDRRAAVLRLKMMCKDG